MGAAGAAAPRILVRVLLPLLAIHTLPARSMAIPVGVDRSVGSAIPPEGEIADAAFENKLTALLPSVTHTWPDPSMAMAAGEFSPPPEVIVFCAVPTWLVSFTSGPVPTLHTFPAWSIATSVFAPPSAPEVIP